MREMTVMKTPALAVVGPDRQIVRSTEGFRRYEDAEKIAQRSPELECVLTGYADAATIKFGDLNIEVEAITDASGRRQAKLTLPPVAAPEADVSATMPPGPDQAVPEDTVEEIPVSRPTEAPAATPPAPPPTLSQTAELLQTNLELARKWADRDEALQEELRQAQAAAARAAEDANRWRSELEQTRAEALRLSDELDQTLERFRSWLGDFETALESPSAPAHSLAAS
jgi:hypothetical protein